MARPRLGRGADTRWLAVLTLVIGACTNDYDALGVVAGGASTGAASSSSSAGSGTSTDAAASGSGGTAGSGGVSGVGGVGAGVSTGGAAPGGAGVGGNAGAGTGGAGGMGGAAGAGGVGGAPGTGGMGGGGMGGGGMGGGGMGGGGIVEPCDVQYGQAPEFVLCNETALLCEFYVANAQSCQVICEGFGGECLAAWDNNGTCGQGSGLSCTTQGLSHLICQCSHGCGGTPACTGPQVCAGGSCQ